MGPKSKKVIPAAPNHLVKLNNLIEAKQSLLEPNDGRLELAMAIAAVTSLVTVDSSTQPFETVPDDLFDRNFNDSKVGISDDQMPVLKANLARLLPEIADDIDQIPDNAALPIEKVAEFIRVSILAQSTKG